MSFAKPLVASVSIRAFGMRSIENADGWGLAWYPDQSLAMVKQPVKWTEVHTEFLDKYPGLVSSTYVAHVRHRTSGGLPTRADTHPFSREYEGREYCFAHNGTLKGDFWEHQRGRFHPLGSTDSEFMFCLLLEEIDRIKKGTGACLSRSGESAAHVLDTEAEWSAVHSFLLRMNRFGALNCILTDGQRVAIYHDLRAWKGLTFRNVFLTKGSERLFGDGTMAVNIEAQPVNYGVIVATNPLSAEGWEKFHPGEMKVLFEGNIEHAFTAPADAVASMEPKAGLESKAGAEPKVRPSAPKEKIPSGAGSAT